MSMTSEIKELQDEVREGYVPEKKPAPDHGEPWSTESFNAPIGDTGDYEGCLEVYTREKQDRVAEAWNPEDEHEAFFFARIVACVNACSGMVDLAAEIQAMRAAIKRAHALCRDADRTHNTDGEHAVDCIQIAINELQPFIKP